MSRPSVLFLPTGVSLAHVGRALVLARALDPNEYDIHFACDARHESLVGGLPQVRFWPIDSPRRDSFLRASHRGDFVLGQEEIDASVREETRLYEATRPSLVVQDFRPTVSISAELAEVRHAAVANVYSSPYRALDFDPYPEWPLRVRMKRRISGLLHRERRLGMTASLNAARVRHGLSTFESSLYIATSADHVLYAEPEGFIRTEALPAHHLFLGPIIWSPDIELPTWWGSWDTGLPLVYVTLGSTGDPDVLPRIVRALADLPAIALVATAARTELPTHRGLVFGADYLPGVEACRLADLVVCNGGSATGYQALSEGTPVVGVWSNLDQYLSISAIECRGAGVGFHSANASPHTLRQAIAEVLAGDRYREGAAGAAKMFGEFDAPTRFNRFVRRVLR
jgi:UDP:flavonoid glycosyltransferase YjiC (YdhE family)